MYLDYAALGITNFMNLA